MSDMSFKQAKELVERLEFTELTLNDTLKNIEKSSENFQDSLKEQEEILLLQPRTDKKLNSMKIIVALNIGFVIGLAVAKYIL
jgi:hypothetical protein